METIYNYINGSLQAPVNNQYLDNINPAIGAVYSQLPDSDTDDVEKAVQGARRAQTEWASMSSRERSDLLMNIAKRLEDNLEPLAEAESTDNGKPLWLSKSVDIPRASQNFHFFATAILHEESEFHQTDQTAINYTYRSPVGLAGCISPWNLPLYLFTWKIAPALATGNCVIAKPSEITPMTAFRLSEICMEAGLPPGVLNIVHGLGGKVGQAIVEHPDIPALSFTGGTKTGAQIARTAGPQFKKLSLELGGKNPNIVFGDCDFEEAVKTTMRSSFANQGEICLCGSRVLVEDNIYHDFKEALYERTRKMKVGDPFDAETNSGAVVSQAHQENILSYIRLAEEEGGRIVTGGNAVQPEGRCQNGYFVEPTIIEGLSPTCRTNQEEIFGPVITLIPFSTEEEALQIANSTEQGLSASIWTQDLTKAHRVAHHVEAGIIWINCWLLRDLRTPFGGMKSSGIGREGGKEALKFFTEPKNVCVKL